MGWGAGRGSSSLLNARQIRSANLVLREIRMRAEVPAGCGARLTSASMPAMTLSGGEAAALRWPPRSAPASRACCYVPR